MLSRLTHYVIIFLLTFSLFPLVALPAGTISYAHPSQLDTATDFPTVDPDYIYDQLFYMVTHYQHRESGYYHPARVASARHIALKNDYEGDILIQCSIVYLAHLDSRWHRHPARAAHSHSVRHQRTQETTRRESERIMPYGAGTGCGIIKKKLFQVSEGEHNDK